MFDNDDLKELHRVSSNIAQMQHLFAETVELSAKLLAIQKRVSDNLIAMESLADYQVKVATAGDRLQHLIAEGVGNFKHDLLSSRDMLRILREEQAHDPVLSTITDIQALVLELKRIGAVQVTVSIRTDGDKGVKYQRKTIWAIRKQQYYTQCSTTITTDAYLDQDLHMVNSAVDADNKTLSFM